MERVEWGRLEWRRERREGRIWEGWKYIPVPLSTSNPAHLLWVCDQELRSEIHNLKLHNVILGGCGQTKWEGQESRQIKANSLLLTNTVCTMVRTHAHTHTHNTHHPPHTPHS